MKKALTIIIVIILVSVLGYFLLSYRPSEDEKEVIDSLQGQEVNAEKVEIKEKEVVIEYLQPIDFEEDEELYATWAYIFSEAKRLNPDAEKFIINCKFEDGEEVKVTVSKETVDEFMKWEISASQFLQKLDIEALTKGPKI